MGLTQAILLGCLQGLTEFLPISSSAHLVAAQKLLGINSPGVALEVAAHFGTLLAIMIVFARRVAEVAADGLRGLWLYLGGETSRAIRRRAPLCATAVAVLVGTVPAVGAGVLLQSFVERSFESLGVAGALLVVTGLLLWASRLARPGRVRRVAAGRGLLVGVAQAAALLPGISRSGATIVCARFAGVERGEAARFSFILAVPALAGAALYKLGQGWVEGGGAGTAPPISGAALTGTVLAATLVGTVCLLFFLRVIERGRLHWFAAYCLPAGAAMMLAGLLEGA